MLVLRVLHACQCYNTIHIASIVAYSKLLHCSENRDEITEWRSDLTASFHVSHPLYSSTSITLQSYS